MAMDSIDSDAVLESRIDRAIAELNEARPSRLNSRAATDRGNGHGVERTDRSAEIVHRLHAAKAAVDRAENWLEERRHAAERAAKLQRDLAPRREGQ